MTSTTGRILCAAALCAAFAGAAQAQTNQTGRQLVASDNIKLSALTERTTSQGIETVKELLVPHNGIVRVRYQFKSTSANHFIRVSVRSTIANCESITSQLTYKDGNCDVRVVAGDKVTVGVKGLPFSGLGPPFATGAMKNVTTSYDVINATGLGAVLKN